MLRCVAVIIFLRPSASFFNKAEAGLTRPDKRTCTPPVLDLIVIKLHNRSEDEEFENYKLVELDELYLLAAECFFMSVRVLKLIGFSCNSVSRCSASPVQ